MKNTICWTDIPVTNLDRAIAFYSAVLGEAVSKQTAEPGVEYALLPWAEGVVSGCLYVAKDSGPSLKGPLVYLSDQRLYPLSFGLYALNIQSGGLMGIMMAGSLLMTLPVIVIFFFAQRYFIQGITLTGMK